MKIRLWVCSIIIAGLCLTACGAAEGTPPPPSVTPATGPSWIKEADVINQADGFFLYFYLVNSEDEDTTPPGTVHIQLSKPLDAGGCVQHAPKIGRSGLIPGEFAKTECFLLAIEQRVDSSDYVFDYRRYIYLRATDIDEVKQWGWHYWYTSPLISLDQALEEVEPGNIIWINAWFENEDGRVFGRWLNQAAYREDGTINLTVPYLARE